MCELHHAQGLNHQQFEAFLEYVNCDYPDVVHFSAVHWLSRTATLKRLWNLQQEIKLFMEGQHLNVIFLCDENFELLGIPHRHYTSPVKTELETTREKTACEKLFEHICAC